MTRPSHPHRTWSPLAALLAFSACGADATTPSGERLDATARPLPVSVMTVQPVDGFDQERTYTGEVVARQTAELGFEVTGKIIAIEVDAGSAVAKGQVLARLDPRRLLVGKAEIDARLEQANAALAEMRAGPRKEVIRAAQATVSQYQKEVELAKLQLGRKRALFAKEVASQEDIDIAATSLETVEAQLDGAKSRLEELESGTRSEQILAQEAHVKGLAAQLEKIGIDVEHCVLMAPFAGTISTRHFDVGGVVDAGRPVVRLVETGRLEARIGVPAAHDRVQNANGAEAEPMTIAIAGHEYRLKIARALPELDPRTRTRTIVFELPSSAATRGARPGEIARLKLARRVQTSGFWLPLSALAEGRRGLWVCYLVDSKKAPAGDGWRVKTAEVEVLHLTIDRVLVRGTLLSGDRVLTSGTQRVVPGQLVAPTETGGK